jgi:hypothetical protein
MSLPEARGMSHREDVGAVTEALSADDALFGRTQIPNKDCEGIRLGGGRMVTQAQRGNPDLSATEAPPPGNHVALIAGAALAAILAVLGVYLVAFRSLPTTVSWEPSVSAIAKGGDLTVTGQITPAESGRKVLVESSPNARGPWKAMLPNITTDSRGRFTGTFKPEFSGSIIMRVVVNPAGRYLKVTGEPVRILSLSSLRLKGIGTPTNRTPVSFAVTVNPASAGRTVRIEQSRDKRHWVAIGLPAKTKADGTSVVKVSGLAIGKWSYRATVAQDDSFAAALSPLVGATVEDYNVVEARVAAEQARQAKAAQAAADAATAAAARESVNEPGSNKPNCPVNQGPISGDWCLHSANGPDNPGYVKQCEIPGVPKYLWPAATNGKCD